MYQMGRSSTWCSDWRAGMKSGGSRLQKASNAMQRCLYRSVEWADECVERALSTRAWRREAGRREDH